MSSAELGLSSSDGADSQDVRSSTSTVSRSFDPDVSAHLAVHLVELTGVSRASVIGEIDLGTAAVLDDFLSDFLARTATRALELDLGDVMFFDCSGLNVLLRLRRRAIARGVTLTVQEASPVVLRVLDLTDTRALFAAAPPAVRQIPTGG